ncbi:hypothetical protein HDZ31DRAFT_66386 [Schizophyllum fasciatum]
MQTTVPELLLLSTIVYQVVSTCSSESHSSSSSGLADASCVARTQCHWSQCQTFDAGASRPVASSSSTASTSSPSGPRLRGLERLRRLAPVPLDISRKRDTTRAAAKRHARASDISHTPSLSSPSHISLHSTPSSSITRTPITRTPITASPTPPPSTTTLATLPYLQQRAHRDVLVYRVPYPVADRRGRALGTRGRRLLDRCKFGAPAQRWWAWALLWAEGYTGVQWIVPRVTEEDEKDEEIPPHIWIVF